MLKPSAKARYLGSFEDRVQPRGTPERERYEAKMAEERHRREENERLRIKSEAAADLSVQNLLAWGVIRRLASQPECQDVVGLMEYGAQFGVNHDTVAAMKRAKLVYEDHSMCALVWSRRAKEDPSDRA